MSAFTMGAMAQERLWIKVCNSLITDGEKISGVIKREVAESGMNIGRKVTNAVNAMGDFVGQALDLNA